jgi:hypothetical protein
MVQDNWLALLGKRRDRGEGLLERFSGDESAREAVLGAQVGDSIRHPFFGGNPEDQIAQ